MNPKTKNKGKNKHQPGKKHTEGKETKKTLKNENTNRKH